MGEIQKKAQSIATGKLEIFKMNHKQNKKEGTIHQSPQALARSIKIYKILWLKPFYFVLILASR
jgi:hypothetical protein